MTIGNAQLKDPQFGWCDERFAPTSDIGVGDDAFSWAIDGHRVMKWHDGDGEEWGEKWTAGDVLGCMADLDAKTLSSLGCLSLRLRCFLSLHLSLHLLQYRLLLSCRCRRCCRRRYLIIVIYYRRVRRLYRLLT